MKLPKPVLFLSIGASALLGLSLVGSLLNNQPQQIGESIAIDTINPPEKPTAETAEAETLSNRLKTWTEVKGSFESFLAATQEFDTELRLSRSQRWLNHASIECLRTNCKSPYSELLKIGKGKVIELQQMMITGTLPTDSEAAKRYRELKADILDIGQALASENNTPPMPSILTQKVSETSDRFIIKASQFESLRQAEALRSYQGDENSATP